MCDLLLDKKCNKELNFDIPKKFVKIQRKDILISAGMNVQHADVQLVID